MINCYLVCRRAQEEQERRDYELALRLAQDESQAQTSIQVASVARPMESRIARRSLRRSDQYASKQHEAVRKKYDLSKWKYAELRDTINTSVGGCGMWACLLNVWNSVPTTTLSCCCTPHPHSYSLQTHTHAHMHTHSYTYTANTHTHMHTCTHTHTRTLQTHTHIRADIELLEACRDEFHRRLKVYHAWKMQNRAQKKTAETQRMPASVQQEGRLTHARTHYIHTHTHAHAHTHTHTVYPLSSTHCSCSEPAHPSYP